MGEQGMGGQELVLRAGPQPSLGQLSLVSKEQRHQQQQVHWVHQHQHERLCQQHLRRRAQGARQMSNAAAHKAQAGHQQVRLQECPQPTR